MDCPGSGTGGVWVGSPGSGFVSYLGQRDLARRLTSLLMSCGLVEVEREVEQWVESLSVRRVREGSGGGRASGRGWQPFCGSRLRGRWVVGFSSFGLIVAASRGGSRSSSRKTGGLFC